MSNTDASLAPADVDETRPSEVTLFGAAGNESEALMIMGCKISRQRIRQYIFPIAVLVLAITCAAPGKVVLWIVHVIFTSLGVTIGVGLGLGLAMHVYEQLQTMHSANQLSLQNRDELSFRPELIRPKQAIRQQSNILEDGREYTSLMVSAGYVMDDKILRGQVIKETDDFWKVQYPFTDVPVQDQRAPNVVQADWPSLPKPVAIQLGRFIEHVARDYVSAWYMKLDSGIVYRDEKEKREQGISRDGGGLEHTVEPNRTEPLSNEARTENEIQQVQQPLHHPIRRKMVFDTLRHRRIPFLDNVYKILSAAFGNLATRAEHVNLFSLALLKWTRVVAHTFKVYRTLRKHAIDKTGKKFPTEAEVTREFLLAGKLHRAVTFGLDVPSLLFADAHGQECGTGTKVDATDDTQVLEQRLFHTRMLKECELDYNRVLAHRLVRALIPRQEFASTVLSSLVVEIFSGCVLQPLMSIFTPVYLNGWIIAGIGEKKQAGNEAAETLNNCLDGTEQSVDKSESQFFNPEMAQPHGDRGNPDDHNHNSTTTFSISVHGNTESLEVLDEERSDVRVIKDISENYSDIAGQDTDEVTPDATIGEQATSDKQQGGYGQESDPRFSTALGQEANIAKLPTCRPSKLASEGANLVEEGSSNIPVSVIVTGNIIKRSTAVALESARISASLLRSGRYLVGPRADIQSLDEDEADALEGPLEYVNPEDEDFDFQGEENKGAISSSDYSTGDHLLVLTSMALIDLQQYMDFEECRRARLNQLEVDVDWDDPACQRAVLRLVLVLEAAILHGRCESSGLGAIPTKQDSREHAVDDAPLQQGGLNGKLPEFESLSQLLMEMTSNIDSFETLVDHIDAESYSQLHVSRPSDENYEPDSNEVSTLRTLLATWLHTGQMYRSISVIIKAHRSILSTFYSRQAFLADDRNAQGFAKQLKALDGVDIMVDTMAVLGSPRLNYSADASMNVSSPKPRSRTSYSDSPAADNSTEKKNRLDLFKTRASLRASDEHGVSAAEMASFNVGSISVPRYLDFNKNAAFASSLRAERDRRLSSWERHKSDESIQYVSRKNAPPADAELHQELHNLARIFYNGTNVMAVRDAARKNEVENKAEEIDGTDRQAKVSLLTIEMVSNRRRIEVPDDDSSFLLKAQVSTECTL